MWNCEKGLQRLPGQLKANLKNRYTVNNHYHLLSTTYREESVMVQKGKVSASAWLDRKVVTAMATNCQPDDSGTVL